ncbi:sensor histidine kinase [Halorussus gelatinilyticus]|uniref:histidine kinase n=1 Tax=Halorussus gelatinilyticus TaxID=2937524 RepID=A0A8U0IG57_9EURY|nr:sensor histidine kinase [Halorussus gelatinilyticus]UPV99038.1 sensor histidine kinase [Halorussus gelatinilyticus]
MKVRTKFAVLMLVVTLVLSGVVYGQLELAKDRSVAQMRENVDQTAIRTAEQIDAQIRQQKDYVGFHASRPRASNFSRSEEFLRGFLTNPYVFAGQVVAANGTVVAFEGDVAPEVRRETVGNDIENRTYFQRPARTGEIHVTDPERVADTDQHIVIISAPIFEDGEITGVLAAAFPVNEFTFLTMVKPLETDVRTVSVGMGNQTLHESRRSFIDGVSSTATVSSTGWTVRVSRNRATLNARLREMAILQAGSLALVLALVVGLAVWEYNANIRQAEKLLDGFRALRDGDYDHTPGLSSGEEWHQIREGFTDLADSLATRETELREREQRIQVFNRVLRHNLRNDMTVVVNYAEYVADESENPEVREAAEKIAARGWDLVDLSEKARRFGAGMEREGTEPVDTDVAAVVADAAAVVREEYPDADVSVEAPDRQFASATPAFDAAVENVCENAVEHNDADPTVSISVESVTDDGEEWVRVAVADDGPGIPDHERAVLTDGGETDLEHGSGLGLWLVHWVVERSGGRLSFAENDPRGSVVRMDLRPASDD